MKKIFDLLFSILIVFLFISRVEALSLEKNEINLAKGETKSIALTENFEEKVKKLEFNFVYYSNDITGRFQVNSSYQDKAVGVKHEITFPNGVSGEVVLGEVQVFVANESAIQKGNINISNVQATTMSGKVLNLKNESLQVTVGDTKEKQEAIEGNLIEKIESSLVQIPLKENTYEYSVFVKSDIDELDLKPVAKYPGTNIDISSQKLEDAKENVITIQASIDDIKEEYQIKVKREEDIQINKNHYKQDNSYKKKWSIMMLFFGGVFMIGLFLLTKGK